MTGRDDVKICAKKAVLTHEFPIFQDRVVSRQKKYGEHSNKIVGAKKSTLGIPSKCMRISFLVSDWSPIK